MTALDRLRPRDRYGKPEHLADGDETVVEDPDAIPAREAWERERREIGRQRSEREWRDSLRDDPETWPELER